MLNPIRLVLLVLAALALTACAGPGLQYHYGGISAAPGGLGANASVRVVHSLGARHFGNADGLLIPLFQAAIAEKGYPDGGPQATHELVYEVRKEKLSYVEQRPVVTSMGTYQRMEMTDETRGGIAVAVVETASGKTVYTASTSSTVTRPLTNDEIRRVVSDLLKRFPPAR